MSASSASTTVSGSVSGSVTSSVTGSVSGSATGNNTSPTGVSIPQTAAAGGLLWTQPPSTASPSFYKIAPNQQITFGWNLTSLFVTPTSLTLSAFCPDNANTYPITTIPATVSQITWDPYAQQQSAGALQFAQATYTVWVMDERGMGVGQKPGLFSPNNQLKFALYSPPPYTPLSSWTCQTCSGAATLVTHPAMFSVFATLVVMLISGWRILRY